MNPRLTIQGIAIGSCGRVLHPTAARHGIVRASDTTLWPETAISITIVL